MLNLYWKIFLGFWTTGLLLGGGALLVNQQLQSDLPLDLQGLSPAEIINRTSFIVRRLPQDMEAWQAELADYDIYLFIDKPSNKSLSQATPPANIASIFEQLQLNNHAEQSSFTRLLVGKKEQSIQGQQVNFVLDMPSVSLFRIRQFAEQLTVQLVLAIGLSAVACFILARYLTRNLKELSSASQALAAGDLTTRIPDQRRLLRDELSLLAQDFNHMAESLERSVENQRRLVRDVSHELRSPLARLQIALELARKKHSQEQLDRIEREAERLNDLIGQILAMPDNQHARKSEVDLGQLLTQLTDDNKLEAHAKQVDLVLSITPSPDFRLQANALQIESAIENVIRNAIHYTNENTHIGIELNADKHGYHIAIEDHGPGVPEADLSLIFEPFYRVDPARNRKTGGYGVGLAIVKRSIEQHGGKVLAQNTGQGLRVTIDLPRS